MHQMKVFSRIIDRSQVFEFCLILPGNYNTLTCVTWGLEGNELLLVIPTGYAKITIFYIGIEC